MSFAFIQILNTFSVERAWADTPNDEAPILHMKFENDFKDSSPSNRTTTPKGNPGFISGPVGQAVELKSSASQSIDLGGQADFKFGEKGFAFAFWMKAPSHSGQDPSIISNKDWKSGANQGYNIGLRNNDVHVNVKTSGTARKDYDIKDTNDNKWHHIAISVDRDKNRINLFKDGSMVEDADIAGIAGTIDTSLTTRIGADGNGFVDGTLNVQLDEFKAYARPISLAEVSAMYAESSIGKPDQPFKGSLNLIGAEQAVQGAKVRMNVTLHAPEVTWAVSKVNLELAYDSDKFEFAEGTNVISADTSTPGILKLELNARGKVFNQTNPLEFQISELTQLYFNTKGQSGTGQFKINKADFYSGPFKFDDGTVNYSEKTIRIYPKTGEDTNKDGLITVSDLIGASEQDLAAIASQLVYAPYKRVVFFGIDGAGVGVYKDAPYWVTPSSKKSTVGDYLKIPYLRSIIESGAISYTAQSCLPTMSSPNWGAMLSGVGCTKHGLDNGKTGTYYYNETNVPTVFKSIKEAMPQRKVASIASWENINNGHIEPSIGVEMKNREKGGTIDHVDDDLVATTAEAYIKDGKFKDTAFMFVYLGMVDEVGGHSNGFYTKTFYDTINDTDKRIEQVVEAIKAEGLLDDTLLLFMSDHGGGVENSDGTLGSPGSHGLNNALNRTIFFAANGRTVATNPDSEFIVNGGTTSDMAATILASLGIENPASEDSRVVDGMFVDQVHQNKANEANLTLNALNQAGAQPLSDYEVEVSDLKSDAKAIDLYLTTKDVSLQSVEAAQEGVRILRNDSADGETRIVLYASDSINPALPVLKFKADNGVEMKQAVIAYSNGTESFPNLIQEIEEPVVELPVADVIDIDFLDGTAQDHSGSNNHAAAKGSSATIAYSPEYKKYVGKLNGTANEYFTIANSDSIRNVKNQFTLEAAFTMNTIRNQAIFGNTQSGGLSFESTSGGNVELWAHIAGSYKRIGVQLEAGKQHHLVASYDGQVIILYLNGTEVSRMAASGALTTSSVGFAIGADPEPNGTGNLILDGDVSIARLYSFAVSADQAKRLYTEQADRMAIAELNELHEDLEVGKALADDPAKVGNNPGQYPEEAMNSFRAQLDQAAAIFRDRFATEADVRQALAELQTAREALEQSRLPESQDNRTTLVSSNSVVLPGQEVTVTLGLDNLTKPVYAQDLTIEYDSDVFEYVSSAPATPGLSIVAEKKGDGQLRILLASTGPSNAIIGQGEALNLLFKAKSVAQSTTGSIKVTGAIIADETGAEITAGSSSVAVTVRAVSGIEGDVNGDGKVSLGDLAIVAAHYGKNRTSPDWETAIIADVNGDGRIDIEDLALIASKLLD